MPAAWSLHTVAKKSSGQDFENIPLITQNDGTIVTLGDVATIRDGFVDEDVITQVDGHPAVLVRIDATDQQSVVDMADDIRDLLAGYEPPDGASVSIWNDTASPIFHRLLEIVRNGAIGTILVFITLVLVFELRIALWITVGIPLSFVGSLLFFDAADLTLNLGTLFGFFLLVGIVVVDSVVVGESIAAERDKGKSALDAAISGARAMVGPLTIGAITTILAFLPFLFITSSAYQIVNVFPYVAIFVLLVSLVAAFFILPAHLSHGRRWSLSPLSDVQSQVGGWLDEVRDRVVAPAASWAVRNVWLSIVGGVLILVAALLLIGSDTVRIVLFDENLSSIDHVQADLYLPADTPFEETLAAAEHFVEAVHDIDEQLGGASIDAVSMLVGNIKTGRKIKERLNSSHLASVRLHLNERPERTASPAEIERAWRQAVGPVSNLEKAEFRSRRSEVRPSVSYSLIHDDMETLRAAAAELKASMVTVPGIFGISDDLALGKRHFEVELTPAGEAAGLTPALIGRQLRASFHGAEVQRIQRGREEIKVVVRYPAERRRSLSELASERIHRPGGGEVPLSLVARITEKHEPATLTRIDGKRAARVEAWADTTVITPIQARREIHEQVVPDLLATYPGLAVETEVGARREGDMLETLGILTPIVLIAIYALIAAFLRSYWKPLIAVVGIPIAFAGAVVSHWILGWDLTTMSLFGMIAVGGVVVNDALVRLDRYNIIRRDNAMIPAVAAASAATRQRFRAVFLTTVLGLSSLLYERSDELIVFVPFVVSMLGGALWHPPWQSCSSCRHWSWLSRAGGSSPSRQLDAPRRDERAAGREGVADGLRREALVLQTVFVTWLLPALLRLQREPLLHGGERGRFQPPAEAPVDISHDRHRVIDQIGIAHVDPALVERGTRGPEGSGAVEHAAHQRQLLGAGLVRRARLRGERANPLHNAVPRTHELHGLAMRLDEDRVRVGLQQHLKLHEMEGHLQQPVPLTFRLPLPALPGEVLHDAPVMRVGVARAGLGQSAAIRRHAVRDDEDPGREGELEEHEVLLRLGQVDAVNADERVDNVGRAHQLFRIGPAGIVRRAGHAGVVARR